MKSVNLPDGRVLVWDGPSWWVSQLPLDAEEVQLYLDMGVYPVPDSHDFVVGVGTFVYADPVVRDGCVYTDVAGLPFCTPVKDGKAVLSSSFEIYRAAFEDLYKHHLQDK